MATELKLTVSIALVVAILAAEAFSLLWYNERAPWGRWGQRYWISALIGDLGLAFVIQWITSNYFSVNKWEDAAMLAVFIAALYSCLEAPHSVHDQRSFSHFFYNVVHKAAVVFIMSLCLYHFKNY